MSAERLLFCGRRVWKPTVQRSSERTEMATSCARSPCSRNRSATLSLSRYSVMRTSSSVRRSRGVVVLLPTDLTGTLLPNTATGEDSSPLAYCQIITPHLPMARRSISGSSSANCPMVNTLRLASLRVVAGPTNSKSDTGSGHTLLL